MTTLTNLLGLDTRTIRAKTPWLSVAKKQEKPFIHNRSSRKDQPLVKNFPLQKPDEQGYITALRRSLGRFVLRLERSRNDEAQNSSKNKSLKYSVPELSWKSQLFLYSDIFSLWPVFIYWMRITHMTPDINRVQITFVVQIEHKSPAEPFYTPWFFCLFAFCFLFLLCMCVQWYTICVTYGKCILGKDILRRKKIN